MGLRVALAAGGIVGLLHSVAAFGASSPSTHRVTTAR